jgi:hypothetical protein
MEKQNVLKLFISRSSFLLGYLSFHIALKEDLDLFCEEDDEIIHYKILLDKCLPSHLFTQVKISKS